MTMFWDTHKRNFVSSSSSFIGFWIWFLFFFSRVDFVLILYLPKGFTNPQRVEDDGTIWALPHRKPNLRVTFLYVDTPIKPALNASLEIRGLIRSPDRGRLKCVEGERENKVWSKRDWRKSARGGYFFPGTKFDKWFSGIFLVFLHFERGIEQKF